MDVAHGPSFIYEPPARVLISSGSGGTVPCSAHGIPPPSLSWLDSMEQPVSVIKGNFKFNIIGMNYWNWAELCGVAWKSQDEKAHNCEYVIYAI